MIRKLILPAAAMALSVVLLHSSRGICADYYILGRIESVRKGKLVTSRFNKFPERKSYLLVDNGEVIGNLDVISVLNRGKRSTRVIGSYRLAGSRFRGLHFLPTLTGCP